MQYKSYKSVDVEIDLDDFSTAELIAELNRRGHLQKINGILLALEEAGCPRDILQPLKDWDRNIITQEDLLAWKEFAGVL